MALGLQPFEQPGGLDDGRSGVGWPDEQEELVLRRPLETRGR